MHPNTDSVSYHSQCIIQHVKEKGMCSQCDAVVTIESPGYLSSVELLENLYPKYPPPETFTVRSNDAVTVVTLTGERATVQYSPTRTVYSLQKELHSKLRIQPEKQRLLLRDQELQVSRVFLDTP